MRDLALLIIVFSQFSMAQVGINTLDPQISLALGQDNLGLNHISENHIAFVTNGQTRLSIPNTGFLGINQTNPQYRLDVGGDVRIQNLGQSNATNFSYLAIDSNSEIGKKSSVYAFGQVMRVGAVGKMYNTGTLQTLELIFDEAELAPNNANNNFNDIPGVSNPNTTDHTITLNSGTYSINLKLIGSFYSNSENNRVNVKLFIDGAEHSSVSSMLYGTGQGEGGGHQNVRKMGNFTELIVIPSGESKTIQFKIEPINSNISVIKGFVPSGVTDKISLRTLITISKISV